MSSKFSPYAVLFSTSFWDKCVLVFNFLNGNLLNRLVQRGEKATFGILDYVTFPMPVVLPAITELIMTGSVGATVAAFAICGLVSVVYPLRCLVAATLVLLISPIIGLIHIIARRPELEQSALRLNLNECKVGMRKEYPFKDHLLNLKNVDLTKIILFESESPEKQPWREEDGWLYFSFGLRTWSIVINIEQALKNQFDEFYAFLMLNPGRFTEKLEEATKMHQIDIFDRIFNGISFQLNQTENLHNKSRLKKIRHIINNFTNGKVNPNIQSKLDSIELKLSIFSADFEKVSESLNKSFPDENTDLTALHYFELGLLLDNNNADKLWALKLLYLGYLKQDDDKNSYNACFLTLGRLLFKYDWDLNQKKEGAEELTANDSPQFNHDISDKELTVLIERHMAVLRPNKKNVTHLDNVQPSLGFSTGSCTRPPPKTVSRIDDKKRSFHPSIFDAPKSSLNNEKNLRSEIPAGSFSAQ